VYSQLKKQQAAIQAIQEAALEAINQDLNEMRK